MGGQAGVVWARSCSVAQLCPALCNPADHSPTGSSVHGMFGQENGGGLPSPSGDLPDPDLGRTPAPAGVLYCWCHLGSPAGLGGVGLAGHRVYTWRTRMKEGWGQRPHSTLGPRPD